jgi:hypothetical protein
MPFAQPGEQRGVSGDAILHVPAGRRQNDDVGPPDVADREFRPQAKRAEAPKRRNGSLSRLVTEDDRLLCSGGVYASIDLSLYLVEKFCGHEIALQCAKSLLVSMPRSRQSGYSMLPLSRPHSDDRIRGCRRAAVDGSRKGSTHPT